MFGFTVLNCLGLKILRTLSTHSMQKLFNNFHHLSRLFLGEDHHVPRSLLYDNDRCFCSKFSKLNMVTSSRKHEGHMLLEYSPSPYEEPTRDTFENSRNLGFTSLAELPLMDDILV